MTLARRILVVAGLLGLSGVVLAAMGSHVVAGMDEPANYRSWQSANGMHLLHALVLLFIVNRYPPGGDRLLLAAVASFVAGIVLFSGSIYLSLLVPVAGVTSVAPAGGLLLMLGWLLIVANALWGRSS